MLQETAATLARLILSLEYVNQLCYLNYCSGEAKGLLATTGKAIGLKEAVVC